MASKKTNKKDRDYFKVDEDKVFALIEKLNKNPNLHVDMVTCSEVKVTWTASKYSKEDIEKLLK